MQLEKKYTPQQTGLLSKHFVVLLLALGLLLALFAAVYLAGQRQELRKRAAGSGDITVSLSPSSANVAKGGNETFSIVLTNNSGSTKSIKAAGVDISVSTSILTITSINCGSALGTKIRGDFISNKIYLSCYVGINGSAKTIASNASITLGSFTATVEPTASNGDTANLSFTRTLVPDATTEADLSNAGSGATITVGTGTTPSKTPTKTPVKSPTKTPVKSPTKTPVKSPTKTPVKSPTKTPVKSPTKTPIPNRTKTPTPTGGQAACISSNGTWKNFPNSCADGCSRITDPKLKCSKVITKSCDCGSNKCWNGSRCVKNPVQVTPTKTPVKSPTKTPVKSPTKTPVKSPTKTPVKTPTKTPTLGPSLTPVASCVCGGANACHSSCTFQKVTSSSVSYANPFVCGPASASTTDKNTWCQRQMRGKGDADGVGGVDLVDYDYYRRAVLLDSGIPATVNADFNGDGEVGIQDARVVLIQLGILAP